MRRLVLLSVLASSLLLLNGCPPAEGPTAAFSATPLSGIAPLSVTFDDQSDGAGSNISSWSWDFGDGSPTSGDQNPTHIYETPGTYSVSLTVTTSNGSDTVEKADYISVDPPQAIFESGAETVIETETVGETGGIITTPPTSPIGQVVVDFPAGALPGDTEVSVGVNDGVLTSMAGAPAPHAVVVNTPGVSDFDQPVEITFSLPALKNDNAIAIPYYVDDNGQLHLAQLTEIDHDNGTATFQTYHASLWTWIVDYLSGDDDSFDTNFRPADDGFQIVNTGSNYNRGGECFGMTSFALWYHENYSADGDFYDRFMDVVGQDANGVSWRGQNIIATRTFISIAQQWNVYWAAIAHETNLSDADNYTIIANALANTANPVLIYLYHDQTTGTGAHSVLAYAYDGGDISIYDPNHPGTTKTIQYDTGTTTFATYSSFDGIIYNGDGSLNLTEPYTDIYEDAKANFHDSADAVITVSSHTNGQEVTQRNITLTGTIQSGPVAITELEVFVGPTSHKTAVGYDGAFSIELPIQIGDNHLVFNTRGDDSEGNLMRTPLPNNMRTVDFVITGVFDHSVILTTLTWDKNDTDLDTYVIDPNGDYSCYYNMTTADGGELDIDDVNGYGPEHWTLLASDTVRYDQDYQMRVHYFSDHGNGPTNYTVTITLYEGTSREMTTSYRGNLSVSSPYNNGPTGTGADWADIATIRPTQAKALSRDQIFQLQDDGTLLITVPVEPFDKE